MDIKDICMAAGWFARFYNLDVCSLASQVLALSTTHVVPAVPSRLSRLVVSTRSYKRNLGAEPVSHPDCGAPLHTGRASLVIYNVNVPVMSLSRPKIDGA